jgi:puromycin-sensitive aminopeptidase
VRGLCLVAALLGAAGVARAGASARLPASVTPERYSITFEPDLKASTFTGRETIQVKVRAATQEVRLHAVDLTITGAAVTVGKEVWPARVTPDPRNEMIVLALPRPLPLGTATLTLHWTAKLSTKLRGLYAAESEGRRYAFTQFEATDARRAFPGFDEPAMKARFEVTAVIDPALSAISNGRILSSTVGRGKKTVRFAETPPMSSYLVALAVGPLVEAVCGKGPVKVCVWSPPGKQHLGGFALEAAEAFLPRFGEYFGIPYPYGKLDLVAVPDFAAGAMENTGAIFFREARLLVDPKTASLEQRRGVADIIAHEMAHQWFGDLVTMQWWDDLWLNEAFATWMEVKIVDAWRPDWNVWTEFEGWKAYALSMDQLSATHPIRTPVTSPDQVNENFDAITYSKGASVLRMLEIYLGEAAFQKGVQRYLAAHANANATADDLWRALSEASGQPVAEVAASWLDQPGFPMVSVSQRCKKEGAARTIELTLSQRRFFAAGPTPSSQTWLVPICARAGAATQCELMRGPTATMTLRAPGCAPWVLLNPHHSGFYRVRYDAPVLKALGQAAQASLDAPERIGLVADAWAMVKQGALPLTAYLETVMAMKGERTREVLSTLHEQLGFLEDHLVSDADRAAFRAFVGAQLAPLYAELGWEPARDEPDTRRLLRATVLWTLGMPRPGRWTPTWPSRWCTSARRPATRRCSTATSSRCARRPTPICRCASSSRWQASRIRRWCSAPSSSCSRPRCGRRT